MTSTQTAPRASEVPTPSDRALPGRTTTPPASAASTPMVASLAGSSFAPGGQARSATQPIPAARGPRLAPARHGPIGAQSSRAGGGVALPQATFLPSTQDRSACGTNPGRHR